MNRPISPRWLVGWIVAIALAGLYFSGKLDYLLYNVGLNHGDCGRNGYGATFCGSDLTDYQTRFDSVFNPPQPAAPQLTFDQQQCANGAPAFCH